MVADVFENWNRYYDPFTGRYLQPEPMLSKPRAQAVAASGARAYPTYSYVNGSPTRLADPDGNGPCTTTYDCCVQRAIENGEDPHEKCGGNIPNPKWDKCNRERAECKNACNAACDAPSGPLSQQRLLVCYAVCDIALAACMLRP